MQEQNKRSKLEVHITELERKVEAEHQEIDELKYQNSVLEKRNTQLRLDLQGYHHAHAYTHTHTHTHTQRERERCIDWSLE